MKKIVLILVLLVYSASTIGATVHLHYCMDKFVGWTLWHDNDDDECGNCGMKENKGGCCKDEHKKLKIDGDHQKTNIAKYVQLTSAPALAIPFASYIFKATAQPSYSSLSNAPARVSKRLHLFNCVFLI